MKTIWLVSEGAYSDYRITAAFETEAEAKEYSRVLEDTGHSDVDLMELELGVPPNPNPEGMHCIRVLSKYCSIEVQDLRPGWVSEVGKIQCYDFLSVTVLARNGEHARKIAADKFREYVALNPHCWRER